MSLAAAEFPIVAILVVTPYYNKPTQEGLYRHYCAIADSVELPLILYNVPGRTGVDLLPETVVRLAHHQHIVSLKDATADLKRVAVIRDSCGARFSLLSGDDATSREFMLAGGDGVISVTGNVAPAAMRALCDAARAGDRDEAGRVDAGLLSLHSALFRESNPIPVKWAVEKMGLIGPGIRLPLTELAVEHRAVVASAMAIAGIETLAA
jgi:4-hydroxy-tetrahydrodipicolinate synthase